MATPVKSKPKLGPVLVMPFWSQANNMNADSNYTFLRRVLPEFVKHTSETVFLLAFPDPNVGSGRWRYKPDGLQSDRIRFVSWPYDTNMRQGVMTFDSRRWYDIETKYAPTIVWLNQVESGVFLYGGYWQSFAKCQNPTIVAQHHYIIHKSLPYPLRTLFPRLWLQMGGSYVADRIVYNSQHAHNMANESFGEWMVPEKLKQLEDKTTILRQGLVEADHPVAPMATAETPPVFLYNHRFEAYKQPEVTFAQFERLKTRHKFQVWATQVIAQMSGGKKRFHYDRVVYEPDQRDYFKRIAAQPMINTINSVHETFCISILDSISCGHIVVVPNAITFPELLPRNYPYMFNTEREQLAMLNNILSRWPDSYNEWHDALISHAREHFGIEQYAKKYIDLLYAEELPRRETNPKASTIHTFNKAWASMPIGKRFTPNELQRVICRIKNFGLQAMPYHRVVREFLHRCPDAHLEYSAGIKLYRK